MFILASSVHVKALEGTFLSIVYIKVTSMSKLFNSPCAGGAEHQSSRMVYVFRRRYSCHSMESVRKIKVD